MKVIYRCHIARGEYKIIASAVHLNNNEKEILYKHDSQWRSSIFFKGVCKIHIEIESVVMS